MGTTVARIEAGTARDPKFRTVERLRAELAPAGVARARVLVDEPELPYLFFYACGFGVRGPQPTWLFLPAGRRPPA